jgi:hypothetical protein
MKIDNEHLDELVDLYGDRLVLVRRGGVFEPHVVDWKQVERLLAGSASTKCGYPSREGVA